MANSSGQDVNRKPPVAALMTLPLSRIRILIDGVEGGHADHLTNPTAHDESPFVSYLLKLNRKIISETYFVPGLRIKLEVGSSSLSYSANIK